MSAIGGLLLAIGLAGVGVGVAGGGADLVTSLIPAVVSIGLGMAIPPVLGALLGLVIVSRPPRCFASRAVGGGDRRRRGRFRVARAVLPASLSLGLVVALIIATAAGVGYPLILRSSWRRATASR